MNHDKTTKTSISLNLNLCYDGENEDLVNTRELRTTFTQSERENNKALNSLRNFPIDDDLKTESRYGDENCDVNASVTKLNFASEVFIGFDTSSDETSDCDDGDETTEVIQELLQASVRHTADRKADETSSVRCLKIEREKFDNRSSKFESTNNETGIKSDENAFINSNKDKQRKVRDKPFACHICNKRFHYDWALSKHANRHEEYRSNNNCPICYKKFSCYQSYLRHANMHNDTCYLKYICDRCGNKFYRKGNLTRHIKKCGGAAIAKNVSQFLCTRCGKICSSEWQLKQHMMFHDDVRPFPCDLCSKRFRYSSRLKEHRRTHLGLRPFPCKQCVRSFNTISELHKHAKRHKIPGYRMYNRETDPNKLESCPICLRLVVNLHAHTYIHTGSGDVRCNVCSKTFKSKTSLYAHAKLHTKPMGFSCDVCGRKFNRKSNMVCHRELHSKSSYKPKMVTSQSCKQEKLCNNNVIRLEK